MEIIKTIGIGLGVLTLLAVLIVFSFNLLVKILVNERTELVAKHTCNNHVLEFYNHSFNDGGGDRDNLVIYFDGRLILNDRRKNGVIFGSAPFPADPKLRTGWIVKTYLPDAQGTNLADEKNIYINPTEFTQQEFDELIKCYEQNKNTIDQAIIQLGHPWNYRIARIIYGVIPPKPFESLK